MTPPNSEASRLSWRVFLMAWIVLSLLCAAWAISTPLAAVPDEPAHLIKAASVVRGDFVGTGGENGQVVTVPQWVAFTHVQTCFAFDGAATADCVPPVPGDPAAMVSASTTAGLYNPLYYSIVGLPSLIFTDSSGVFAMRILGGVVTAAFFALSIAMLAALPRRRLPLLAVLAAITPMTLFLGGGVNPNGLETSATLAAFVGVLSLVIHPDGATVRSRAIIVALSAAIAVNMRGLSPLWVVFAISAPLLVADGPSLARLIRRRSIRWMIVAIGIAGSLSLAWILGSRSLLSGIDATGTAVRPDLPSSGASPLVGFYSIVQRTFELAQNMVGIFGWLDTPAPLFVFFAWSAFVGVLVIGAFVGLRGRALMLATALVGGIVIIPAIVQAAYVTGGGLIWQGRYTLPLFVCAIVGIGVLLSESFDLQEGRRPRRLAVAVILIWATAQLSAFAMSIRRYSVGVFDSWVSMVTSPAWSPPGGVIPALFVYAILIAAGSFGVYMTMWSRSSSSIRRRSELLGRLAVDD